MANHPPKGHAYMLEIASRDGVASGRTRHKKKVANLLGIPPMPVELLKRPKRSGGSHDNDWRCPHCHHFNSEKRRACAECKAVAPMNGRPTRKALRERAAEHRTRAVLGKHGL
jgi:hypothetical protein